jgi:hypothetical protein
MYHLRSTKNSCISPTCYLWFSQQTPISSLSRNSFLCPLLEEYTGRRSSALLIISAIEGRCLVYSTPRSLYPRGRPPVRLNRRLFGSQIRSGLYREQKKLLFAPEYEPRAIGSVAWLLYLLSCRRSLLPWTVPNLVFLTKRQYVYCKKGT